MDPPQQSLSERLSAVFAAIKKSKRARLQNRGSSSSKPPPKAAPVKDPMEIDTLPDLLVFIKATSNPKVLRDVVARFLLNPLLSDNDRELVKKKIFEKIEEERRKKIESKKAATDANLPLPSGSSSQQSANDHPSVSPPTSVNAKNKGTAAPSASPAPSTNASEPPPVSTQGTYQGSLLEKLKKLDNLNNSGNPNSSNVENTEQEGASATRFDEWVPWPSKKCYGAQENARPQEQQGEPVTNPSNDHSTPAVQLFSTDFGGFSAAPSMFQVQPLTGPPTYQVPLPGIIHTPAPSNHAFAGFATQEAPMSGVMMSTIFAEKDRIPRTPTPSPPPPPRSPDPRKHPGAVVAVISDSGRLIMPGARAFKKPKFVPQLRTEDTTHGRSSPLRSTPRADADLSSTARSADGEKLDRMRSESDDSTYLRNYALHHKEEAKKKIEREGEETRQSEPKRRSRKRGRRSGRKQAREQRECDERDRDDAERDKVVYTRGFEPLPKQKYARNIDDTDGYEPVAPEWMEPHHRIYPFERSMEEGEILDDSFDYGDGLRPRYPEFGPIERPRLDPYEYDRPPRIPSLLDMMGRRPRNSWR